MQNLVFGDDQGCSRGASNSSDLVENIRDSGGRSRGIAPAFLAIIIRKRSHPAFARYAFRDHAPASRDYFFREPWSGLCWPRDELNPDEAGTTTFLLAFGFFFSRVLRF